MKRSQKFLVIFLVLTAVFSAVTAVFSAFELERVRQNTNSAAVQILENVKEKYPEVSERELAEILNGKSENPQTESSLKKYGIDLDSDWAVYQNDGASVFIIIATTICLGIIIVLVLISISEKFSNMLVWLLEVLAKKISFVKKNEEEWMNYIKCLSVEGRTLWKNKRKSISMLGINLLKCLVIYSVVVVILRGNGVLSWFDIIAIMAASYFLAGVIPAPSGVMSLEFVYGLLMGPFLAVGVSVPAILTFRFFTWIYPAVIGGLFKLLYRGWNSTFAPL